MSDLEKIGFRIFMASRSPFAGDDWAKRSLSAAQNAAANSIETGFYQAQAQWEITGEVDRAEFLRKFWANVQATTRGL